MAPPGTTALGALLAHITRGADAATFQPMNINFGLFPPLDGRVAKAERKPALAARSPTSMPGLRAWRRRRRRRAHHGRGFDRERAANAGQAEFWNSASGERWVTYQEALDQRLAPLTEH